ncbi:MAG: hypothetical protein M3450_00640 [Actinomycetota bacterium]|nr:hypothetical protein [Actinomycetota bacterium]MDQ3639993.1 hypothetical protein [Actinomycetota bacterium]
MAQSIEVQEQGTAVAFSFREMLRYSGPGSPGGVALGFKMMERAFVLLEPHGSVERREVVVHTAFHGPGARDACELVTHGFTEGRYVVDPALERPERGDTLRTFAFSVTYRDRTVSLVLREGFVSDEFVRLAQASDLTGEEQQHFAKMKQALADHLMATNAVDVFEVE